MRFGIPPAGNFLHQELAVLTGAVEAMVVDVQCIMQALSPARAALPHQAGDHLAQGQDPGRRCTSSSTSRRALETAREIVRLAIDNYPNRGPVHIPDYHEPLVAGFSHEYLNYMQGGFHRASFRPLNDAIIAGRIRGLAGVVGCNNARVTQDLAIVELIKELHRPRRHGGRHRAAPLPPAPRPATSRRRSSTLPDRACARSWRRSVSRRCSTSGSCVDNSRIFTVLTQVATEGGLGDDIDDLPAVGLCPEWMCEKAVAIGTYFAASRRARDLRRWQPGACLERGHPADDQRLGGAWSAAASSSSPTGRRCWRARSS